MWSNYHTHTHYCDGVNSISELIAHQKHWVSLGFSSHAPLPFDCKWCMEENTLAHYLEDIQQAKSFAPFEIYAGLEVDYIPGVVSPKAIENQVDFTIGSIHFVEMLDDKSPWEIDGSDQLFEKGVNDIFGGNIRDAVARYYELTGEMIQQSCPTILGHLDKIKIHNHKEPLFLETDKWYQHLIKKLLDTIEQHPCIVEVNTRGLYKKKSRSLYPSTWILQEIHKRRIPITLCSDAHHEKELTSLFQETAKELHLIGFRHLQVLQDGEWKEKAFNEYGIIG